MIQVENYIGGKFVTLSDDFDDISPLDFSIIAKVPRTKNVDGAVEAAKSAQPDWGALSIEQRCDWLDKIANELES